MNSSQNLSARVIVALDFETDTQALTFARSVNPALCKLKVGKELFTRCGPGIVESLVDLGFDVFLDLKFHDIPNTVARACRAAADLGVWMVNVHAGGGSAMMSAARESLSGLQKPPLLIAVTILTSLSEQELHAVGYQGSVEDNVLRLSELARNAGLDGVVCSAQEAGALRQSWGAQGCLVTPGIRPIGSTMDDQTRVMTPRAALKAGSSYLVIGRPITQSTDPIAVLSAVNQDIAAA